MFRISTIRTLILLVLLSLVGPAAADAAPRPTPGGVRSLASSLWQFFAPFLQKSGCTIDPYGKCESRPAAAVATTDEGCTIDPYGLCKK